MWNGHFFSDRTPGFFWLCKKASWISDTAYKKFASFFCCISIIKHLRKGIKFAYIKRRKIFSGIFTKPCLAFENKKFSSDKEVMRKVEHVSMCRDINIISKFFHNNNTHIIYDDIFIVISAIQLWSCINQSSPIFQRNIVTHDTALHAFVLEQP